MKARIVQAWLSIESLGFLSMRSYKWQKYCIIIKYYEHMLVHVFLYITNIFIHNCWIPDCFETLQYLY